jgi:hypothetical protein
MESRELRIGNLVSLRTPAQSPIKGYVVSIGKVSIIKQNKITVIFFNGPHHSLSIETYRPIKLDEKWLLEFGFDKQEYMRGYIGIDTCNINFILTEPNEFNEYYTFHFKSGSVQIFKKLKYVHQLQNLFYELYDQELILTKKP